MDKQFSIKFINDNDETVLEGTGFTNYAHCYASASNNAIRLKHGPNTESISKLVICETSKKDVLSIAV